MWKIRVIGNMNNEKDRTFESANRIYDKKYCCPTIPTCGGGGYSPKRLKDIALKLAPCEGVISTILQTEHRGYIWNNV